MHAEVDVRIRSDLRHEVMLNGQDIAQCITGLTLEGRGGPDSSLTLHLLAPTITVAGQMRVLLSDDTQSLLVGLGWTPPA